MEDCDAFVDFAIFVFCQNIWSSMILGLVGLPAHMLPEIIDTRQVFLVVKAYLSRINIITVLGGIMQYRVI